LTVPDRVQARLVGQVAEQFDALVLQRARVEQQLTAALERALAETRAGLATICRDHVARAGAFLRSAADDFERSDGPGRWRAIGPDVAVDSLVANCESDLARERALVRAELANLNHRGQAGTPADEVIVRMARPFATKLISYVLLPALLAGLIAGAVLPLLGILPNVFANVAAGLLTGALGAGLIGFSASATVDWLLSRADELRNRAAFEVQLRRAVIANRDALEAAVVDAQRRAAEATARIVGESSGGRP
jgi:hypothetical protein